MLVFVAQKFSILCICFLLAFNGLKANENLCTYNRILGANIEAKILALEFEQAQALAEKETAENYRRFYKQHISFLIAFLKQEPVLIDNYYGLAKENEDYFTTNTEKNATFLAYLYFERASLRFLNQQLTMALADAVRCNRIVKRFVKANPELLRFEALFQVLTGSLPNNYRKLLGVLGIQGSVSEGLRLLNSATLKSQLLPQECNILAYYIHRNLFSDYKQAKTYIVANNLQSSNNENNVLFTYLLAHNALDCKQPGLALSILNPYLSTTKNFPFISYHLGKCALYTGDYSHARYCFSSFLYYYKGKIFRSDATYKRALCSVLEDNKTQALVDFQQTKNEASVFDEDKYAQKQAAYRQKHYFTKAEKVLLQARFYFDGGQFDAAQKCLLTAQNFLGSPDEFTEWNYRFARIMHEQNQTTLANKYYMQAVAQQPTQNLWMKVYAYFYLGQLAQQNQQYLLAEKYYNTVFNFEDYDYQNGLEQRANTQLQQLRKIKKTN